MNPSVGELLRSPLRGKRRPVAVLAAWSVVEAAPTFLSGRLVAWAIDDGFLARHTAVGFGWLGLLAVSVLVGAWATRMVFVRLAALVEPFRDDLMTRAVTAALRRSTVPGAAADTASVARLSQQVEIVREGYASVLIVVQSFVVTTVSALIGLFTLDATLLLLVVGPLVAGLVVFGLTLRRMAARQRVSILADEKIAEDVTSLAVGLRDVVACGAEHTVAERVGEAIDAQAKATVDLARLSAVRTLATAVGGRLPLVLIIALGPWLVRRGVTVGTVVGALTYVLQSVYPALQTLVRGVAGSGLWLVVTLGRIAEVSSEMSAREERRPGLEASGHDVRLADVTFSYGRHAQPIIEGLDLEIPEGDRLAIVGPSGVGKSTLAGLISGLLVPQAGDVTIGGVPVRDVDPAALGEARALIPQEAYVFAGSVWDNLAYLNPAVSGVDVDAAVDLLGARALVDSLGGYGAELESALLSSGERQLITLVRAYVSAAPVVILDEATCHLDPAAEAIAESAFAERPGTLIVVAHRISSAKRARHILVMGGEAPLLGTHEELLERSPLYRDLVGRWHSGAPNTRLAFRRFAARHRQRAGVAR